jgi:antitoxin VapB
MALQIANRAVIAKIEALARVTGLTKTAAVAKAVDRALGELDFARPDGAWQRFDAILEQIDRVPEVPGGFDPLEWDEHGLPR